MRLIDFRENLVRNVQAKQFYWNPVERLELQTQVIQAGKYKGGRAYYGFPVPGPYLLTGVHPHIAYPSVTTIISAKSDRTWYWEWVDKVGLEEAERITAIASTRGTAIHAMAEKYLRGYNYWNGQTTINIVDFNKMVPVLNEHVDSIYGLELALYSHRLKTAGRTDVAARWDGTNSIIDFKTARREKLKEQIIEYFIQAATYAILFDEIYNLTTPQIVVIILTDHEDEPRVFVEKVDDWKAKVEEYFCE